MVKSWVSLGARDATCQLSWVSSSSTVMSVMVRLPSFLTVILYSITSPSAYFPLSAFAVLVVSLVMVR